jgi:hypothetical protein
MTSGIGGVGKSTIQKQLNVIHSTGFKEHEKARAKILITSDIINALIHYVGHYVEIETKDGKAHLKINKVKLRDKKLKILKELSTRGGLLLGQLAINQNRVSRLESEMHAYEKWRISEDDYSNKASNIINSDMKGSVVLINVDADDAVREAGKL